MTQLDEDLFDEQAMRLSLIAVIVSLAALFFSEVMARRVARRVKGRDD